MSYNSHTSVLSHYTKSKESLLSILEKGLFFSYCKEEFSENRCVGIPMVSFCDIPIPDNIEHITKYGPYAIGLSKEYLINKYRDAISPIHYCMSNNMLNGAFELKEIAQSYKSDIDQMTQSNNPEEAYKMLKEYIDRPCYDLAANMNIGFMKMYSIEHDSDNVIAYDECEWRIVLIENARLRDRSRCKWYWSEKEYEENKSRGDWKKRLDNIDPVKFGVDNIEYLLVPENESSQIIEEIKKLSTICGDPITEDNKKSLISKIKKLNNKKCPHQQ